MASSRRDNSKTPTLRSRADNQSGARVRTDSRARMRSTGGVGTSGSTRGDKAAGAGSPREFKVLRTGSGAGRSAASRANVTARKDATGRVGAASPSPTYRNSGAASPRQSVKTQSRSVGEINRAVDRDARREDRAQRRKTARAKASRPFKIAIVLAVIVAALWISYIVVSQTLAFAITDVQVEGAEHLTEQEALALADIADDATLLNVDTAAIATSFKRDAWVADIKVKKQFPSTLKIVVTERQMQAVVEVPVGATQAIQDWAISADGIWLMAIPAQDSEIGKQLSAKIYEDAASMLLITGVPYGVSPAIGAKCTDSNILNALEIVAGMTTDLSNRVKKVTATDAESTLLTLDDNVEIAFGTADDIREKERIVEEIMSSVENVVYINVRVPERPTWRAA